MMNLAIKIEDMQYEAEILRSMVLVVYDAIYHGSIGYEECEGALHAVFVMSHDHMDHLTRLRDEAYALQRAGKENKSE